MTTPQIKFRELLEARKHNRAQEENWVQSLDETKRSNQANESLKHESNQMTKYSADKHYDASVYSADSSRAAAEYVAQLNSATQRQNAELAAQTSRYTSDQSAAASRYSANVSAEASKYATNVNAATQAKRLAFDAESFAAKTRLDQARVLLERAKVELSKAQTISQTKLTEAQAQKALSDIRVSTENLTLAAKKYGLEEEAAKYANALTKARTFNTEASSVREMVATITEILKLVAQIEHLGGK